MIRSNRAMLYILTMKFKRLAPRDKLCLIKQKIPSDIALDAFYLLNGHKLSDDIVEFAPQHKDRFVLHLIEI